MYIPRKIPQVISSICGSVSRSFVAALSIVFVFNQSGTSGWSSTCISVSGFIGSLDEDVAPLCYQLMMLFIFHSICASLQLTWLSSGEALLDVILEDPCGEPWSYVYELSFSCCHCWNATHLENKKPVSPSLPFDTCEVELLGVVHPRLCSCICTHSHHQAQPSFKDKLDSFSSFSPMCNQALCIWYCCEASPKTFYEYGIESDILLIHLPGFPPAAQVSHCDPLETLYLGVTITKSVVLGS